MNDLVVEDTTTTWDEVFKGTGFKPEEEKDKEEPMYIEEIYREVGSFPFKIVKVRPTNLGTANVTPVGGTKIITRYYDREPGTFLLEDNADSYILDSKSWRLVK